MRCLVDPLEIVGCLRERIGRPVEVVARLGPVGLGGEQVVEHEAEFLSELADRGVALVNQLPTALGDLPVSERAAEGPTPPADPVGGLIDGRRIAGLLEPVSAGQPGQPGAHDHDPRAISRTCRPCVERGKTGRQPGCCGQLQQVAAAESALSMLGQHLVGGYVAGGGLTGRRGGLLQPTEQLGSRHNLIPPCAS